LVVLPSLGTSVGALWQQAAMQLAELSPESTVIGIDLPGHGRSAPIDVPAGSTVAPRMTVRELAEAVQSTLAKIQPDVAASGTPTQIIGSAQRWFGEGFMDREPEASAALLHSLQDADRFSYAALCYALAEFDVRRRLPEISLPLLAVAGSEDQPTPATKLAE